MDPITQANEIVGQFGRQTVGPPLANPNVLGAAAPERPQSGLDYRSILAGAQRATQALLAAVNDLDAKGIAVQQDLNPPILGVQQLRFTNATVADLGGNIAAVTVNLPDPASLLAPATAATTGALAGAVYTPGANPDGSLDTFVFTTAPVDGVVLVVGNRLLVKNEGSAANGVWVVDAIGATIDCTRASDYRGEVAPQKLIGIISGTVNGDLYFAQNSPDTDPLQIGGPGGVATTWVVYPVSATAKPLVETVGATGTYATIDAAVTAFALGQWGDGINFSIVLVDAGPFSTDWSGLPGTTECLRMSSCTQAFPEVTFTAPFPGDVELNGSLTVFVDTTHLCERAADSVRVVLDGLATVNAAAAAYDLARSPSPPFIMVVGDATVQNARFFATDLGGTPSNSFIYTWRGFIFCDSTLASSGTGAGAETTILGNGSSIQGSHLSLSGVLLGCSIEQTSHSATDRLQLLGQAQGCTFILNRDAGGTAFTYTLGGAFGARIEGCEFITGDNGGAVAGSMSVLMGASTDLIDTILPSRTALGTLTVGATVARSIVRCSIAQLNNISVAAQKIDGLVLGDVPGNTTLDAPVILGVRITATSPVVGLGVVYTIGSIGNRSSVQDLRLEMGGAANYALTVAGEVLRDITCLNPEPDPGSSHIFGSMSGSFPGTQIIENLNVRGDRGGSVIATIIAVNLVGFIGRLDAAGETLVDPSLVVVHAQKLVVSGNLVCEFRAQPPAIAPPLQHGVLESCEVAGTATISSFGGGAAITQQISNCLFVGAAALTGGAGIDLHLVNTRFVALPTIGGPYDRAVVGSSISDAAVVIGAGTTVVAGSIGIS